MKIKRHSEELKKKVLADIAEGISVSTISHRIKVHPSVIYGWKKKYDPTPSVRSKPVRRERPVHYPALMHLREAEMDFKARNDTSEGALLSMLALRILERLNEATTG